MSKPSIAPSEGQSQIGYAQVHAIRMRTILELHALGALLIADGDAVGTVVFLFEVFGIEPEPGWADDQEASRYVSALLDRVNRRSIFQINQDVAGVAKETAEIERLISYTARDLDQESE